MRISPTPSDGMELQSEEDVRSFGTSVAKADPRADLADRRSKWLSKTESAVANAVPIRVRLVSLLNEARRHERKRAAELCDPSHLAAHLRLIDEGYRNLIRDVSIRCEQIAKANAPPQQQFTIGTEAIGCFSSMLPWSDSILTSITPPQSPNAADKTLVRAAKEEHSTMMPPPLAVPTRLNMDHTKLAATVASRRRVLLRIKDGGSSSCASTARSTSSSSPTSSHARDCLRSATRSVATAAA